MSVIQRIRDKGAWFVFGIIALALLAFILQDAFMKKGSLSSNTSVIGKINGENIDRSDFQSQVQLYEQMSNQESPNTGQTVADVWNRTVFVTLLKQEENKLGLVLSGKELNDVLFGSNPPQWMTQAFTDPNTGQYNVDQARQQFAQMKKNPTNPKVQQITQAYLQPTIEQELSKKYQSLISGAIYIPHWLAAKANTDNNSIANIKYVYVPYSSTTDTTIKISDDEINDYVQNHAKEYEQKEETRNVSFVKFDASPSKEDSNAVLNELNTLKPQLETATEIKSFISTKGSALPYDESFVTKSSLKVPHADTIMHLAVGQTFGPYLDNQDYVIAKMIGERMMPDSAKCRHILIKTQEKGQVVLADSVAKKRIDSIATAIAHGADFNAMVQKYSDDDGSKTKGGEYTFPASQFSSISKEFAETIFYGKTGDKKTVHVENDQYAGYHYIEVLDQKNIQPAYNVAYLAKPIVSSAETINAASTAADQFAATTRNFDQFKDNAAKQKLTVLNAQQIKQSDFSAGAIGENRTLVKWIYDHKVGEVSDPVSSENGGAYVVVVITAISKAGLPDAQNARPLVENILINQKKALQIIDKKIKGTTLEATAQTAGVSVQKADSISFRQPFLPNIGNEPKIAGAAFNKDIQTKISSPIAGNSGVFVIQGTGISANASMAGGIDALRKQMEIQMRGQIGYGIMSSLKDGAEIKDFRSDFY
jgi:peptidyl-prolyl cis-trans isomerase D